MSLKSHAAVAAGAVGAVRYVGRKIMGSDSPVAREAQRKVFATMPHDQLLRLEELVGAELSRRRSRPMGPA